MLDISVLRKELEKTGYLDEKVKGIYDRYLFKKKHKYLMLVDHPITVENRMTILKQAFRDLCMDEELTWRDRLFDDKMVIIVGRTTQSKKTIGIPPTQFRSVHLFPNGDIAFGGGPTFKGAATLPFAFYLINEKKCEVATRELGFLPLTMPKRIKALDRAIQNYLQSLRQNHSN